MTKAEKLDSLCTTFAIATEDQVYYRTVQPDALSRRDNNITNYAQAAFVRVRPTYLDALDAMYSTGELDSW